MAYAAIAAVAVLAALGFVRWPLTASKVGDSLNAAFGPSPRLHWSAPRAASFSALPWPCVRITGAELNDAYGDNLLAAPMARLDLSLTDLIRGRIIPRGAALESPTATLDLDRPPFAGAATPMAAPATVAGALAPLAALSLSDGVLRIVSAKRRLDTRIASVRGRLNGLAAGDQLRFNLSAEWRGAPVAVVGSLADPEGAAKGAASAFALAINSPVIKFAIAGSLEGGATPTVEGDMNASAPSIAALAKLLDAPRPPGLAADDVAIAAAVRASPSALALSNVTLTVAGQTFEGALDVGNLGGRPLVSGTFATDGAAIEPLVGSPERLFDPARGWSGRTFAFEPPEAFDLDLRLSAARLDVYGQSLVNAAASILVKDGGMSASLIDASVYDGRLQGEASVERLGDELRLHARAELTEADLGQAFANLGRPVLTGQGGARFAFDASGASPAAAIASLTGSASLDATDGALVGVNLEEALRRSQRRRLDVSRDMRLGGTAFERLAVALTVKNGRAEIERGDLSSPGMTAGAVGTVDLLARAFAVTVNAVQTDATGQESPNAAHLKLEIDGPWAAPAIRAAGDNDKGE